MFGITTIVKGCSIQTYLLYYYAIFISEDITRQRGAWLLEQPVRAQYMEFGDTLNEYDSRFKRMQYIMSHHHRETNMKGKNLSSNQEGTMTDIAESGFRLYLH